MEESGECFLSKKINHHYFHFRHPYFLDLIGTPNMDSKEKSGHNTIVRITRAGHSPSEATGDLSVSPIKIVIFRMYKYFNYNF